MLSLNTQFGVKKKISPNRFNASSLLNKFYCSKIAQIPSVIKAKDLAQIFKVPINKVAVFARKNNFKFHKVISFETMCSLSCSLIYFSILI
jgi:hypothetical protein